MFLDDLKNNPIIPLIKSNDPVEAVLIARALVAGGLRYIEVVLRTERALECIEAIATQVDGVVVGAGTVLTVQDVDLVVEKGAKFIVSPGLSLHVVERAQSHNIPIFPGVMSASEVQAAWGMGLRTVKFFPASLIGGVPMLKTLGAVFGGMQFIPTGGISESNLLEFLSVPCVVACGGSWLTPAFEVTQGNYQAISNLATAALRVAAQRNTPS